MLTNENVTRASRWSYRKPRKCSPVALSLSYSAQTRQRLRALVAAAGVPQGEFAKWVLGCDPVTICSYLGRGEIPKTRAYQINRIERVIVSGDLVLVQLRGFKQSPRWRSARKPITYKA